MNTIHTPAQFASVPKTVHRKWQTELKSYGILYLYAMFGYGKTCQACHFAKTQFKEWAYCSATDPDFLEMAEGFANASDTRKHKSLLILDDVQWVRTADDRTRLFNLLLLQARHPDQLEIMLLSRARLPEYLVPLRVTQRLIVDNHRDLLLDKTQMIALFTENERLAHLTPGQIDKCASHCLMHTHGCALWVQMYLQHIGETPDSPDTALAQANCDIVYQLDHKMLGQWPERYRTTFLQLAVFPCFTIDMAKQVLGQEAPALIDDFLQLSSILRFTAPDLYSFHPEAHRYLTQKLETLPFLVRNHAYLIAAEHYEKTRAFEQSLACYHKAGQTDKIIELVIYLLENAEGCTFAELSEQYINLLTPERELQNPRITGAKAMLAAYRMNPEESSLYLKKLKQMAHCPPPGLDPAIALSVYIRTLIASPCVGAEQLKENLLLCSKYVHKCGTPLKNIMPTGNFPSVLNGGLDLLAWVPNITVLFAMMKPAVTLALGVEGVGAPDAAMGEILYEQNKHVRAMASLTHALSDANFKGSIRVQYAVTGIMARLLQSEGQLETAREILLNISEKASQQQFLELLPNIQTSLMQCALLQHEVETYTNWLQTDAPDEHRTFYITTRFGLLCKARVYTALGRTLEALYILDNLAQYAALYHRPYLQIELLILSAIILHQRKEEWQPALLDAVQQAAPYQLVRVFADQGAALLPLWKQMDWSTATTPLPAKYLSTIGKELGIMAGYYPQYLQLPQQYACLTAKEQAVLQLLATGKNNTQIATELSINLGTAKFHVANILKKLKAENRTVAVKIAQKEGLV